MKITVQEKQLILKRREVKADKKVDKKKENISDMLVDASDLAEKLNKYVSKIEKEVVKAKLSKISTDKDDTGDKNVEDSLSRIGGWAATLRNWLEELSETISSYEED